MSADVIVYLSGFMPLGIWLLPMVGGVFTIIWWTTWQGTGFWGRKRFIKTLAEGWIVIILLYSIGWYYRRPPPIPTRVVVWCAPPREDGSGWESACLADLVRDRIHASPQALTLLTPSVNPILGRVDGDTSAMVEAVVNLRSRWCVYITSPGNAPSPERFRVVLSQYKGGEITDRQVIPVYEPVSIQTLTFKADTVLAKMGADIRGEFLNPMPAGLSPSDLHRLYRGMAFIESERYDSAEAVFSETMASHPDWTRARAELVQLWLEHYSGSHYDELLEMLTSGMSESSKYPRTYLQLGRFFLRFHKWQEAESALKLAYNFDPDNPETYYYLSRLSVARIEDLPWQSSADLLARAVHLAPGYELARLSLSRNYLTNRKPLDAQLILEEGLEIDPNSILLLLNLSAVHLGRIQTDEAIDACRRILQIDPRQPNALYNLGIANLQAERIDEAIAAFDSSYNNGGSPNNLFYLGDAYYRKGEFEKAIKYFSMRLSFPEGVHDKIVLSARERIKQLKWEITQMDTTGDDIQP